MRIDVSDLLRESVKAKEICDSWMPDAFEYMGEQIKFAEPVKINATAEKTAPDSISVLGDISAKLLLNCGICLDEYIVELYFPIKLLFTKYEKSIDDEEDIYLLNDDAIELDEAVVTNIIMALPSERRCKEDCKGLCPVCGINLNKNDCNCDKQTRDAVDIRLAALKDFFE